MIQVNTRDELIYLLTEAAELEHSLCCQYLFAALSLKRDVSEGLTWEQFNRVSDWAQTIFMVARQEMEHLSLVCNLLTAIGGSPHFDRPNFPHRSKYFPLPFTLERFSEDAVCRFARYERPEGVAFPRDIGCPPAPPAHEPSLPQPVNDVPSPMFVQTIGGLYDVLRNAFQNYPLSDNELFIGPPRAQVGGDVLNLNFPRIGALGGVYDATLFDITNRATAIQAIDLIIEQGEGLPDDKKDDAFTHYMRFLNILKEYRALKKADPSFEPARNVIDNPMLYLHDDAEGGNLVTDPMARDVLGLFNAAYNTMLLLMMRFYGHTDETPAELAALTYTLFPMMTMSLRPIGEVLTQLPASENPEKGMAGPSFELPAPVAFLPHKRAAWAYLNERFAEMVSECYRVAGLPNAPARLKGVAENMDLLANKFARLIATPAAHN
jgi:hypothetical protein